MRNISKGFFHIARLSTKQKQLLPPIRTHQLPVSNLSFNKKMNFCTKKPVEQIQHMELKGKYEETDVGGDKYFAFKSEGALSMVDSIKGTKDVDNGEVYVLMSTCGKCNTKSLRSFTKNAYHNGVVLLRCEGCDNVHLVADNLGWFDDKPKNI